MNLRGIKKDIEYVIGAFIEDCSLFHSTNANSDSEALENLLNKAVELYNDLRDRVNAKIEGKNAAYYDGIRKELLEKTDALYDELSGLVKSTVKNESKPAAKKTTAKKAADGEEAPAKKPAAKKAPAKKAAAKKEEAPAEDAAPAKAEDAPAKDAE